MSETTIVNLTLEFTLEIPSNKTNSLGLITETLMQEAVNATKRNVFGTGYSYDYTHKSFYEEMAYKKSRRGLTVRKHEK